MSENLSVDEPNKSIQNIIQDDVDHETKCIQAPSSDKNYVLDGSGSGHDDMRIKKKKTRRGKPKRRYTANPYTKLSWQQRKMQTDIQKKRNNKKRSKIVAPGQALAPYNSNQFLIEDHDHGYLKEIEDRLQTRIKNATTHSEKPRTRDSSFSVDSDMDYYSSPEDEEEFLTREFSNTYQDIRTERLNSMTREELMQECIQMENRLEMLTKCLSGRSPNFNNENGNSALLIAHKDANGSVPDIQLDLMTLMNENETLRRENERLRKMRHSRKQHGSVSSSTLSSSVDSESDSSSGSSSSDSESSVTDAENRHDKKSPIEQSPPIDYTKVNGFHNQQIESVLNSDNDNVEDSGGGNNDDIND